MEWVEAGRYPCTDPSKQTVLRWISKQMILRRHLLHMTKDLIFLCLYNTFNTNSTLFQNNLLLPISSVRRGK